MHNYLANFVLKQEDKKYCSLVFYILSFHKNINNVNLILIIFLTSTDAFYIKIMRFAGFFSVFRSILGMSTFCEVHLQSTSSERGAA